MEIRKPKNGDQGQTAEGRFIVVDGTVILTDMRGDPAADNSGKFYKHKLRDGENATTVAGRLTKELRKALRRDGPGIGFEGPISYPPMRNA